MEQGNNGQHIESTGAQNSGQCSKKVSGAEVGQKNGPALNMTVPPTDPDADWASSEESEH